MTEFEFQVATRIGATVAVESRRPWSFQINAALAQPMTAEEAEEEAAGEAFAAEAARRLLRHWEWKGDRSR